MDLSRLDSDHQAAIENLPSTLFSLDDILSMRLANPEPARQGVERDSLSVVNVDVVDHILPGEGGHELTVRLYTPRGAGKPLPVLLWIHGGAMVVGHIDEDDELCRQTADVVGCVVASVGYRLAPENPFPAGLEDCFTALTWLAGASKDLGIDELRIAVGGASAGGGLAASLALFCRDRPGPSICFQLLIYPMLDDSNTTSSSHRIDHPKLWNRHSNQAAWRAYLGQEPGSPEVPVNAVPARAGSLAGLPPAYLAIGEFDMFLDEVLHYGRRLAGDGVPIELHVYPGAFHGSDQLVPDAPVSIQFNDDKYRALRRSLEVGVA